MGVVITMKSNGIILYETADHEVKLNVNTDGETVWLNRAQLSELFDRDVSVIGRHINNVFTENEVDKESNVQKMHIANTDKWSVNCRKICNSSNEGGLKQTQLLQNMQYLKTIAASHN